MINRYIDFAAGNDGNLGTSAGAGNAWKTLQYALLQANTLAATDEVTIWAADGTYAEQYNGTYKQLVLRYAYAHTVHVRSTSGDRTAFIVTAGDLLAAGEYPNVYMRDGIAKNLDFRDMTFGCYAGTKTAFALWDSAFYSGDGSNSPTNIRFRNVVFSGGATASNNRAFVYKPHTSGPPATTGIKFIDCQFKGNAPGTSLIWSANYNLNNPASNVSFLRCTFTPDGGVGVSAGFSIDGIDGLRMRDCTSNATSSSAASIAGYIGLERAFNAAAPVMNAVVEDSLFASAVVHGLLIGANSASSRTVVRRCHITALGYSLLFRGCTNARAVGNKIFATTEDAVLFKGSKNCQFLNNNVSLTVGGNVDAAMLNGDSADTYINSGLVIRNNLITVVGNSAVVWKFYGDRQTGAIDADYNCYDLTSNTYAHEYGLIGGNYGASADLDTLAAMRAAWATAGYPNNDDHSFEKVAGDVTKTIQDTLVTETDGVSTLHKRLDEPADADDGGILDYGTGDPTYLQRGDVDTDYYGLPLLHGGLAPVGAVAPRTRDCVLPTIRRLV